MTKTREQLIDRALIELGVVAAGQVANAEDSAIVSAEIDPVMSDLASRNVYNYGDPDIFEDDAFTHLAVCLANSCARSFGMDASEQTRLMAEARLRQLSPGMLTYQVLAVDYF